MEGQAEAYNQTWLSSVEVQLVKLFLAKNPSIGNHFHQKISSVNKAEDLELPENENSNEGDSLRAGQPMFTGMAEMHRKSLSQVMSIKILLHYHIIFFQALFNYWIYEELKECKEITEHLFGPYYKPNTDALVTYQESVEMYLAKVEECRIKETYKHIHCSGNIWTYFDSFNF